MAHLQYYAYEARGKQNQQNMHFSSAVRIGSRVEVSGQTGRDSQTAALPPTLAGQIDAAFANIELALQTAGVKGGWKQVFRVTSYHAPGMDKESVDCMVRNLNAWCPDHCPVFTCAGVTSLVGGEEVRVEIEVAADDGDGAQKY